MSELSQPAQSGWLRRLVGYVMVHRRDVLLSFGAALGGSTCLLLVPLVERHAAQQIKADIERDGTTKVGSVEVGLFDRKIVLNDLRGTRVGAAFAPSHYTNDDLTFFVMSEMSES